MSRATVWPMKEGLQRFIDAGNTVNGAFDIPKKGAFFSFSGTGNVLDVADDIHLVSGQWVLMDGSKIRIANGCLLRGLIRADTASVVRIGKRVRMHREVKIHAAEGRTITIGSGCLFSNVVVRTSDLHSIIDIETGKRTNFAKDVRIGPRVWLAEDVNVYKGANIGAGSIIGARSTVYGNVPENCLAIGTPALPKKFGVTWDRKLLSVDDLPSIGTEQSGEDDKSPHVSTTNEPQRPIS